MSRTLPTIALATVATLALAACGKPGGDNINDPNIAETSKAMPGAQAAAPATTATPPPPGEGMAQTPPTDTAPPPTESTPPQY